jgi:acetyl-CoA carboxylase biotin carboxyl carrier protein
LSEDVNLDQIQELVKLVEKHHLTELTVEEDGVTITIKGVSETVPQPQVVYTSQAPAVGEAVVEAVTAEEESAPEIEQEDVNTVRIEAPMVGVFYRSQSPDSPPFIEVGDTIELGQTIGLIEAMKVFSEVPSEVAGVVVDIPAQNSKLVQQGDLLAVVRMTEEG